MEHRRNEPPKTWFRSDRLFRVDGEWYFHTREGIAVGPYRSQFEAEVDVGMLKALLRATPPERAIAVIREFVLDSNTTVGGLNDATFTDYVQREGIDALKPTTA